MDNNNETARVIRFIIMLVTAILMLVTLFLQLFSNRTNIEIHFIIRLAIVILSVVLSLIDLYLEEKKDMWIHILWAVIWLFNLHAIVALS